MQHWLYAIDNPAARWHIGDKGKFWVEAHRDDYGVVQYRIDGLGKGEPRWDECDPLLIANLTTGRIIADAVLLEPAKWNQSEEYWEFVVEFVLVAKDGPTLDSLGIEKQQGARQRLSRIDYERARKAVERAAGEGPGHADFSLVLPLVA